MTTSYEQLLKAYSNNNLTNNVYGIISSQVATIVQTGGSNMSKRLCTPATYTQGFPQCGSCDTITSVLGGFQSCKCKWSASCNSNYTNCYVHDGNYGGFGLGGPSDYEMEETYYMWTNNTSSCNYGILFKMSFIGVFLPKSSDTSSEGKQDLIQKIMGWYFSFSSPNNMHISSSPPSSITFTTTLSPPNTIKNTKITVKPGSTGKGCYEQPTCEWLCNQGNTSESVSSCYEPLPGTPYYGNNLTCKYCPPSTTNCNSWLSNTTSSTYQSVCTNGYTCKCASSGVYYLWYPNATNESYFYEIVFQLNYSNIVFSIKNSNNDDLEKTIKKYMLWYFEIPDTYESDFSISSNYSDINFIFIYYTFSLTVDNFGIQPGSQGESGICYDDPIYFTTGGESVVPTVQTYSGNNCSDTPAYISQYL